MKFIINNELKLFFNFQHGYIIIRTFDESAYMKFDVRTEFEGKNPGASTK